MLKNKLAVIGGTGKSGNYLTKLLLANGIDFKLLLRNPEKFQLHNEYIEIVKGDARNYESVHSLIRGCDTVISLLGQPKGEPTIFSQATKNVIRAMAEHKVNRYIVTTGLNVDTPQDQKSQKIKMATDWMKSNYPETTNDKQLEFELLTKSNINWTLIRLPLIELTDERRKLVVSLQDCPGEKISATDLVYFIFDQLSSEQYNKQAPFIGNV